MYDSGLHNKYLPENLSMIYMSHYHITVWKGIWTFSTLKYLELADHTVCYSQTVQKETRHTNTVKWLPLVTLGERCFSSPDYSCISFTAEIKNTFLFHIFLTIVIMSIEAPSTLQLRVGRLKDPGSLKSSQNCRSSGFDKPNSTYEKEKLLTY